nr:hypothetical protein [Tanacetum cinerariifolium]
MHHHLPLQEIVQVLPVLMKTGTVCCIFPCQTSFTDPLKLLHLDNLSLDDNDKLEIKHQSHRHPLTLNVEPQHSNMPSTSDSIEHPLKLINIRTTRFKAFTCDVCRLHGLAHGLCYSPDDEADIFTGCINCCAVEISHKAETHAIKKQAMVKLEHEGHPEHTLTLQIRPAAILCDACKTEEKDLFYLCDSCDFCIHKTCTSLASTLGIPHHANHPLVLVYSLPEKFYNYSYYCELCDIYIRRDEWLYHCANCRYFAHIKCALNAPPPSTPRDRPSTSGANEDSTLDDNDKLEIKHQSHRHPLTLNVEPQHSNMPSTSDSIESLVLLYIKPNLSNSGNTGHFGGVFPLP